MLMKKALLFIGTVFLSAVAVPVEADAFSYYLHESSEMFVAGGMASGDQEQLTEVQQIVIQPVQGENVVNIVGAQGQVLEIVSLTGRRVESIRLDSPAQRVELNLPKGCYILKVGKTARKVTVK
jgi:uncharacterized protein YcgI (DUF1989 family)